MKVKVRFLANMGIFMGINQMELEFEDYSTVKIIDVLEKITSLTGKNLKAKIMNEKGESTGRVRIVLNGKDIVSLSKFETKVSDGDEISMFPALGAGSI
ncbi:MAG: MoaD family protein [Candidatus Odinarchaeia archaeon]